MKLNNADFETVPFKEANAFKTSFGFIRRTGSGIAIVNPSYKLPSILYLYDDEDHYLTLPKDKIVKFCIHRG
jgi:hypothetical protein